MSSSSVISKTGHEALVWVPAAVCTVVVCSRLFLRFNLKTLGSEDLLMFLAWMFQFIAASLTQAGIDAVPHTAQDSVRVTTQSLYTTLSCVLSLTCGKISVGLLLLRLIGPTSHGHRRSIIASIVAMLAFTYAFLPADMLSSCDYTSPDIKAETCLDPLVQLIIIQLWNFYAAFIDVFYSILPITFLWKLQMNSRKKIAVTLLLSLGWIASVFTILRATSGYIWGDDSPHAYLVHLLANYMEPALVIVTGSLATLVPLSEYRMFSWLSLSRCSQASPCGRESAEPAWQKPEKPIVHGRTDSAGSGRSHDGLLASVRDERGYSTDLTAGNMV